MPQDKGPTILWIMSHYTHAIHILIIYFKMVVDIALTRLNSDLEEKIKTYWIKTVDECILTDFKNATVTSFYIFQNGVVCKICFDNVNLSWHLKQTL